MTRMMHIGLVQGEANPLVLLPGSPERSEKIASYLEDAEEIMWNREFRTFNGKLGGRPVTVMSTGIGGPSMAIAAEELVQVGAKRLIKVGTCLSTSKNVRKGDIVLVQGSVRMEGVADQYSPKEYPAVSDMNLFSSLYDSLKASGVSFKHGVSITRSSYYAPFLMNERPVRSILQSQWESYIESGAICSDTDSAVLFIAASTLHVPAATVLVCTNDCDVKLSELVDDPDDLERKLINVVLEASTSLA